MGHALGLRVYTRDHLSREAARIYGLEHCVFAATFPRWLANITGNCPHLKIRKYLIENMFVEEVNDPTIPTGHYESLVDFVVELGAEREFVLGYTGAPITKMRVTYCDWVSRTKPWLETFACVAGNECGRGKDFPYSLHTACELRVATLKIGNRTLHDQGRLGVLDDAAVQEVAALHRDRPGLDGIRWL